MIATLLTIALAADRLPAYKPSPEELIASYRRADTINRDAREKVAMLTIRTGWSPDNKVLWFRDEKVGGARNFVRVDTATGEKSPLFDHEKVAQLLGEKTNSTVRPDRINYEITLLGNTIHFGNQQQGFMYDPVKGTMEESTPRPLPAGSGPGTRINRNQLDSPDGKWEATVRGGNVGIRAKDSQDDYRMLTSDGNEPSSYARLRWSADSKRILAVRTNPGDRKRVMRLQLSPPDNGPSQFREQQYDRPGDKIDTHDLFSINAEEVGTPTKMLTVEYGGAPFLQQGKDKSRFIVAAMDRGYGRWRIYSLDPLTGKADTIVDDDPATFVDSTSKFMQLVDGSDEIIYSSERDGWNHLYLSDGKGGSTQITKGDWVYRNVSSVDSQKRQIVFSACGMEPGEDPYQIHYYRIGFDGKNLVKLTPAAGNHSVTFSPDGRFLVDTYSTVTKPQVHELRSAETGKLIATLAQADISQLTKTGWQPAQPFVAKARDGKTDIYGIYYRPSNFDPKKSYPVVEDIYAGPHDSHVRKSFSATDYDQSIAELGFIVVKIDGMGTRNRGKAFHDVCYQNLKDAGLPDRILWMKALAQKEPSMDLDRVGIFGTSAGGQNTGSALLFHPEFYKVGIASCGCHDNRLDKIWWNEQWMGLMGPHYAANSNIDYAKNLKGRLMLIVGELDTNVPPESTYRFGAALQAAGKEYEFVVIPNADHTAGGAYGERKRRDFLVKHLLGVDPPNPN